MIKNQKQLAITMQWIETFTDEINVMVNQPPPADVHPMIFIAEMDAMQSKILDLKKEVKNYKKYIRKNPKHESYHSRQQNFQ